MTSKIGGENSESMDKPSLPKETLMQKEPLMNKKQLMDQELLKDKGLIKDIEQLLAGEQLKNKLPADQLENSKEDKKLLPMPPMPQKQFEQYSQDPSKEKCQIKQPTLENNIHSAQKSIKSQEEKQCYEQENQSEIIDKPAQKYCTPHHKCSFLFHEIKREFFQNIEKQRIPDCKCLSCQQFFFKHIQINSHPAVKAFASSQNIQNIKQQILKYISSFNLKGGLILMDCNYKKGKIIPIGRRMSVSYMQTLKKNLQALKERLYPKYREQNMIISYVPIKSLCYQDDFKKDKSCGYSERQYDEGVYVLKIKVIPHSISKITIYEKQSQYYCCTIQQIQKEKEISEPVVKNLSARQMIKLIKKKQVSNPNQTKKDEKKYFLDQIFTNQSKFFFDHNCRSPQMGLNLFLSTNNHQYDLSIICSIAKDRSFSEENLIFQDNSLRIFKVENIFQDFKSHDLDEIRLLYHLDNFDNLEKKEKKLMHFEVTKIHSSIVFNKDTVKDKVIQQLNQLSSRFVLKFPGQYFLLIEGRICSQITYIIQTNKSKEAIIYVYFWFLARNFHVNFSQQSSQSQKEYYCLYHSNDQRVRKY